MNRQFYSSLRYGPPNFTQRAANLTLYAMAYLSWSEFTTPEREKKLGVMVNLKTEPSIDLSIIGCFVLSYLHESFGPNGTMVFYFSMVHIWL